MQHVYVFIFVRLIYFSGEFFERWRAFSFFAYGTSCEKCRTVLDEEQACRNRKPQKVMRISEIVLIRLRERVK